MSTNFIYNYATILSNSFCDGVMSSPKVVERDNLIPIPLFDENYIGKYYNKNDSKWYLDAEFTQLWEECPRTNGGTDL